MDSNIIDELEDKRSEREEKVLKEERIVSGLRQLVTSNKKNTLERRISKETNIKSSEELINGVNDKVLLDVLSPEVMENEKTKRRQKWCLLFCLAAFLVIQFWAVYKFTNLIIQYSVGDDAEEKIVDLLLKFDVAYITSVIIELIAILKYIVKSVFDASITELIKIFKSNSSEEEKSK